MARPSRRAELLDAALPLLVAHGFEGTSVSMLADSIGVTKAAVSYHLPSKDDLVDALATPFLDALDGVLPAPSEPPPWPEGVRDLVETYLGILVDHRDLAVWLDGDRAVVDTAVGRRLRENHRRTRRALIGAEPGPRARVAASIALGALWRPVRNVAPAAVDDHRDLLVESALAPLRRVREPQDRD